MQKKLSQGQKQTLLIKMKNIRLIQKTESIQVIRTERTVITSFISQAYQLQLLDCKHSSSAILLLVSWAPSLLRMVTGQGGATTTFSMPHPIKNSLPYPYLLHSVEIRQRFPGLSLNVFFNPLLASSLFLPSGKLKT